MKTLKFLLYSCFLAVLCACSEDAFVSQPEEAIGSGSVDFISMVVPDIEMGDATTRTSLYEEGDELKFKWQENDAIGVVPLTGRPLSFPINAENAGKNTAVFDGGGWALRTDMQYAAFFPINAKNQETEINSIWIDYTGQTQANYMDYDFLASELVQPANGKVEFTMKRFSSILKITIHMPSISYGRYGSLIAPEAAFRARGYLVLGNGTSHYNSIETTNFINTDVCREIFSSTPWDYTVYMMIPPADLSGKQLTFRITSDEGYAYEATLTGKNFEAGKAYQLTGTATDAFITNENLIAAAEQNTDVSFIKEGNTVKVNDNLEMIAKVSTIYVSWLDDETVCEEIGYFTNLKELHCSGNYFTSLDVSKLKSLTFLECSYNELYYLDVSQNTNLSTLYIAGNGISSLDVSKNTSLRLLDCRENLFRSIDVSKNLALLRLYCSSNYLTSLDVSKNKKIDVLWCYGNGLTTLDVSMLSKLQGERFYCGGQKENPGATPPRYQPIQVKVSESLMEYYTENGIPQSSNEDDFNYLVNVVQ